MFYNIKPECPAQMGSKTIFDKSVTPWKITQLHLVFDVWLGGDLLKESPCFFVTERFLEKIKIDEISGLKSISPIRVSSSETFKNLYPNRIPPNCFLLQINGKPGVDDIGIHPSSQLIISQKFLDRLRKVDLSNAKIKVFED